MANGRLTPTPDLSDSDSTETLSDIPNDSDSIETLDALSDSSFEALPGPLSDDDNVSEVQELRRITDKLTPTSMGDDQPPSIPKPIAIRPQTPPALLPKTTSIDADTIQKENHRKTVEELKQDINGLPEKVYLAIEAFPYKESISDDSLQEFFRHQINIIMRKIDSELDRSTANREDKENTVKKLKAIFDTESKKLLECVQKMVDLPKKINEIREKFPAKLALYGSAQKFFEFCDYKINCIIWKIYLQFNPFENKNNNDENALEKLKVLFDKETQKFLACISMMVDLFIKIHGILEKLPHTEFTQNDDVQKFFLLCDEKIISIIWNIHLRFDSFEAGHEDALTLKAIILDEKTQKFLSDIERIADIEHQKRQRSLTETSYTRSDILFRYKHRQAIIRPKTSLGIHEQPKPPTNPRRHHSI